MKSRYKLLLVMGMHADVQRARQLEAPSRGGAGSREQLLAGVLPDAALVRALGACTAAASYPWDHCRRDRCDRYHKRLRWTPPCH